RPAPTMERPGPPDFGAPRHRRVRARKGRRLLHAPWRHRAVLARQRRVQIMSSRLAGERVLVTGAASGIGLATCERLVAEGTAVAGLDRNANGLAAAFAALEGSGGTVCTVVADVAERAAIDAAVAEAASRLGGLSGVVNVA